MTIATTEILAFVSPITLEFLSPWTALGLYALCAAPILFLGMRSLAGLGPIRKWVAIGARLAVLLMFVLILGGARFGTDPKDSVLDVNCRAWEFDNLYVTDGAFMPTSGGANPTLTIQANSFRVADHLKGL